MAIDRFRNEKSHTADGNTSDPIRVARRRWPGAVRVTIANAPMPVTNWRPVAANRQPPDKLAFVLNDAYRLAGGKL